MNAEKPQIKSETATQAFYREVADLRQRLPADWKVRFMLKYPAYDSYRGGLALRYVMNQESTNMEVLEGLRAIAAEYSKERENIGGVL